MRIYLISMAAGLLIGFIYGLLNVRSPAPPIVALLGLLGILLGEQVVPIAKRLVAGEPIAQVWFKAACSTHLLGKLPANRDVSNGPG